MKFVEAKSSSASTTTSPRAEVPPNKLSSNTHQSHHLLRYHRAAIDGYVDMLCDASKKDTNLVSEEDGCAFTPTLLAAYNGQLEALRILVGRGGDPEKTAADGSSALHLAASRNHLNCVSFLVNFGVNMWSLNNELHTSKDVAAMEQQKEVLDYLDQMMAKQSALNTKQVQKLKEKAKLAAEKRLKQLRKAQLKAIKQVERDEKYFIKLSSNRQLLRAAHSISDIKLVGKSTPFVDVANFKSGSDFSGQQGGGQRFLKSLCTKTTPSSSSLSSSTSTSVINQPLGRLIGASSIGNLSNLRSRLQSDLLPAINRHTHHQHHNMNQYPPTISSSTRLSLSASVSAQNSDIESAYASSVSSHSDYVSSSCPSTSGSHSIQQQQQQQQHHHHHHHQQQQKRPRYSDLVAVSQQQGSIVTSSLEDNNKKDNSSKKNVTSEQQQSSLKSNSTIANRLRAIGGVSRKVQLKRMLLLSSTSNSTSNLSQLPKTEKSGEKSESQRKLNEEQPKKSQVVIDAAAASLEVTATTTGPNETTTESKQSKATNGTGGSVKSCIKWPPAPETLSRANSEPDFGSLIGGASGHSEATASEGENILQQIQHSGSQIGDKLHREPDGSLAITAQVHRAPPNQRGSREGGNNQNKANNHELKQQHHLLTQCLSQLKMQHEAIYLNQQQVQSSKTNNRSISSGGENSDELLRHQISAGEFPLRPSLIKQQQHQYQFTSKDNHSHVSQIKVSAANCRATGGGSNATNSSNDKDIGENRSTTVQSVDSIGSASSFIQRFSPDNHQQNLMSKTQGGKQQLLTSTSSSSLTPSSSSSSRSQLLENGKSLLLLQQFANSGSESYVSGSGSAPSIKDANNNSNSCSSTRSKDSSSIDSFLQNNGLLELSDTFADEQIDLEALMLLTEEDLKSLGILLGPRRKLTKAIELRRKQVELSPANKQCRLFCMVDTQL